MKHLIVLEANAVGAIASSMALFGTGVAAAGDYDGQTYADAAAAIEESGGTPVIVTRVGDQLQEDECLVMNSQDHSFLRPDPADVYMLSATDEVRLNLNCAGGFATATDPRFVGGESGRPGGHGRRRGGGRCRRARAGRSQHTWRVAPRQLRRAKPRPSVWSLWSNHPRPQ